MKAADFRALVQKMRDAQKRYFRTRDRAVLEEAQRLERDVDAQLALDGAEPSLFGDGR